MEKFGLDSTQEDKSVVEEVSSSLDLIKNETGFVDDNEAFLDTVKERVFGGLQKLVIKAIEVSGLEHPSIKDRKMVSDKYHESRDFSDLSGTYFENLIPKGLRSPRKNGRTHSPVTPLITDDYNNLYSNTIQAINLSRKEYKSNRQEIFADSILVREREPYQGVVEEEFRDDGKIEQTLDSAVIQGNKNLIYENISNFIKPDDENIPESKLAVQDIESGLTLDLQSLLPLGYKFIPGKLDGVGAKEGEKIKNLKDPRVKTTRYDFYMNGRRRLVAYGDLTEKGGMLSLFHEIAHTWQSEHIGDPGRSAFESAITSIKDHIYLLSKNSDDPAFVMGEIKINLQTQGFDIDSVTYSPNYKRVENGIVVQNYAGSLCSSILLDLENNKFSEDPDKEKKMRERLEILLPKTGFYTIKSEKISRALDDFVADERDAWAHGLKALRFLRKKGLDIEPELKTLDDFKAMIDSCLATYRRSIDFKTFNVGMGDRFLRRKEGEKESISQDPK